MEERRRNEPAPSGGSRRNGARRERPARLSSPPQTIDWSRFTNFRSRNTRKDLERLLGLGPAGAATSTRRNTTTKKDLLERPDRVGLYPIHWATIHNRSDMIETLFEAGSALAKSCRNRFLANGTPLHLAAMNGALEAAAMLLAKAQELQGHKTRPKTLVTASGALNATERQAANNNNDNSGQEQSDEASNSELVVEMLEARDADGQTPLMRAAAPRSKRMDAVRDLLRKNYWSLGGRPAEMALLLISAGADWRLTEPQSGMNLLHLAIVNDYDDIVSLLLVLDKDLIETRTLRLAASAAKTAPSPASTPATTSENAATTPPSSPGRPLIDARAPDRADELLAAGLTPLQLAILHGRLSAISKLWHASERRRDMRAASAANGGPTGASQIEAQQEALREQKRSPSSKQMKRVLGRACYSNKHELAKFVKPALLKGALALDLALLTLIWVPAYSTGPLGPPRLLPAGLFLVSYVISMALALRVMLKNPGYLRRNSVQYLSELAKLLEARPTARSAPACGSQVTADPGRPKSEVSSAATATTTTSRQYPLIMLEEGRTDGKKSVQTAPEQQTREAAPRDGPATGQQGTAAAQVQKNDKGQQAPLVVNVHQEAAARDGPPVGPNAFRNIHDKVRLFCHKCQCIRRPRSRHCNSCNHCVQDFDHHCIYLGCCVGRFNRFDFLMAMVALAITGIYGSILYHTGDRHHLAAWRIVGFVWIFKYALIGAVSAFMQLRRACLGVTLYEETRSKRIRRTFGRAGPPSEISKSHGGFSILKGSFWRYSPDRFLTGDLSGREILANLREFSNYISPDEYLLTFICTDTPLARSLTSSDSRTSQLYKFV